MVNQSQTLSILVNPDIHLNAQSSSSDQLESVLHFVMDQNIQNIGQMRLVGDENALASLYISENVLNFCAP